MPCVHYRFFSKPTYDAIVFEGLHVTLGNLRREIMRREKLRHCDLLITSQKTNTEYTDDGEIIPNNSTVIIKRIPGTGMKSTNTRRANNGSSSRSEAFSSHLMTSSRSSEDHIKGFSMSQPVTGSSLSLLQLLKTENLAEANVSEEDKIKAVMFQSSLCYYSVRDALKLVGVRPSNYICFRCGIPGHHIQFCPQKRDPGVAEGKRVRTCAGIPRSFLMEVDDHSREGVMLSGEGKYVLPTINVEAYAATKKKSAPSESLSLTSGDTPVPDKLLCPICKHLLTDAAITPCCRNSYCDECIRTCLLESDEHVCPTCKQSQVSPDALVANKLLRQEVNEWSRFPQSQKSSSSHEPHCSQTQMPSKKHWD